MSLSLSKDREEHTLPLHVHLHFHSPHGSVSNFYPNRFINEAVANEMSNARKKL